MVSVCNDKHSQVRFVHGEARISLTSPAAKLLPGERFQRSCICRGRVVEMRHRYGWIQPMQAIDHPLASKNRGDVYVSTEDMRESVALRPGDIVVFYLYADSMGLGAEEVVPVRVPQAAQHRPADRRWSEESKWSPPPCRRTWKRDEGASTTASSGEASDSGTEE